MPSFSGRSDITFMSEEGVFFDTSRGLAQHKASTCEVHDDRSWKKSTCLAASGSQTSISLVNVEMMATRCTPVSLPPSGLPGWLVKLRGVFTSQLQCSDGDQWGWQQARAEQEDEPYSTAISLKTPVSPLTFEKDGIEGEADMSAWDRCGIIYGNGRYDDGADDDY